MSHVQWQAEKMALGGGGSGRFSLILASCSTLRGAERAAADCDRWSRTGFCGVEV
jgi:hypothetical protein